MAVACALLAGQICLAQNGANAAGETKEQRDARMHWWREARFGMFIHWGLYAVPAGTWQGKPLHGNGEWIMNSARIPVADYAALAPQFNPVKFDAAQWVKTAKDAGMKYIVITSKHHDGFAMFHSRVDGYNIYDATPFKRDPLKELADACAKEGIKLGFYYSQFQDWHHPGGGIYGGRWDAAQQGDIGDYAKNVAIPQVREILSNYGPVAVLWWDTPGSMSKEDVQALHQLLRLQPQIITNNRLGGPFSGDTETPEQSIPVSGFRGRDWETCMTINDTWGYKSDDHNFKSTQTLLRNLIDIASKGGNYLLNVGPTAEGLIPQPEVDRLREMGRWLNTNGEAIYGTSASPFKKSPAWGRVTSKPGKLYLHIFNWPADGKLLVPITSKVTKATLLAVPEKPLSVTGSAAGAEISLPSVAPDPIASVIAVDIDGELQMIPLPPLAQSADGSIKLSAVDADIIGQTAALEGGREQNIGFWTNMKDYLRWQVKVDQPGEFVVSMTYACPADAADSEFVISAGDQALTGKVQATGDWKVYKTVDLGKLRIAAPGVITAIVKPTKMPAHAVMNLREIQLRPAK